MLMYAFKGCYSQWPQRITQRIRKVIDSLEMFGCAKLNSLKDKLMDLIEVELCKEEYQNIPIVFSVNDVCPKNTLVDVEQKRVVAILDWEWSGFNFLGADISEMTYPLTNNQLENESFTDSKDVPYEVQHEYLAFLGSVWHCCSFFG
jgi:thiamine kinase-like enzyme